MPRSLRKNLAPSKLPNRLLTKSASVKGRLRLRLRLTGGIAGGWNVGGEAGGGEGVGSRMSGPFAWLLLNWNPPASPISWLSAPMCNGYNPNSAPFHEINENVREAPNHDSSVIRAIFGPSFRRSSDEVDRPVDLLLKTLAKMLATSCIPFQRRGVLLRRLRMENNVIVFHGLFQQPTFLPLAKEQA